MTHRSPTAATLNDIHHGWPGEGSSNEAGIVHLRASLTSSAVGVRAPTARRQHPPCQDKSYFPELPEAGRMISASGNLSAGRSEEEVGIADIDSLSSSARGSRDCPHKGQPFSPMTSPTGPQAFAVTDEAGIADINSLTSSAWRSRDCPHKGHPFSHRRVACERFRVNRPVRRSPARHLAAAPRDSYPSYH